MEPANRDINIMPGFFGEIIPAANIPLQELPEHYTALAKSAKDIYNLWEQAFQNNAVVENAFEDNAQGDEHFAETFEGALKVAAREIEFLNDENTHLKNQKLEITKAAEEKEKSAQELIEALKQENALLNTRIETVSKDFKITTEFLAEKVQKLNSSFALIRTDILPPSAVAGYTSNFQNQINEILEIREKLSDKW